MFIIIIFLNVFRISQWKSIFIFICICLMVMRNKFNLQLMIIIFISVCIGLLMSNRQF